MEEVLSQLFGSYWLGSADGPAEGQCPGQMRLELEIDDELRTAGYLRDSDGGWHRVWINHGVIQVGERDELARVSRRQ